MARLRPTSAADPGHAVLPRRLADPYVEDFLDPDDGPDHDWASHYSSARAYFDGVPPDEVPYVVTACARWIAEHAEWVEQNRDCCTVTDLYADAFGLLPRFRSPAFMRARRNARR